ncbi:MAG: sugar transferase [Chloroflexi bacterium]|nr:sugar transferase [Ktedonobacteraceae bacterium]MBV9706545.1 sugar transferase [Chloroflexota bacterium]
MARFVKSSELAQTTKLLPDTERGGALDIAGTTAALTKTLSRRRLQRRQWRIFECIALIILDAWLIAISFQLAYHLRADLSDHKNAFSTILNTLHYNLVGTSLPVKGGLAPIDSPWFQFIQIGIVVGLILIFGLKGLYKLRPTGTWFRQAWTIITSATLGAAFLIAWYLFFLPPSNSRLLVVFVWVAVIVILCLARLLISGVMGLLYRIGLAETRLLVVGSGRLGKIVMQHIAANPNLGYSIVGFLHNMSETPSDFGRFKMLGTLDDIGLVIRSMQVDEVIIALPSYLHEHAIRSVRLCERLGTSFKLIPDLYELSLSRIDVEALEGIPLIGINQISLNSVQRFVTHLVDIILSLFIILLGLPFWLCITLAIRLNSPGPIVYKQTRIGLNGQPFKMYKFRSMYQDADKILATLMALNEAEGPLFKMKEDPRVTSVGKFLRRTSLDEFPNLINVLRGEMSLVGPRPPLPQEVAQYEEWQKGRLTIKPGLTGLWQVRGRSDINFDEGVLMDLYYIENWSLHLYFQILLRTIPAVLFSRGAY